MWLASVALAVEPGSFEDLWRSVDDLQVLDHLVRRVEAPIAFGDGPLLVRLEEGWIVPVFSGRAAHDWDRAARRDDEPVPPPELRGALDFVGFGFVGTGAIELRLYDRAEPMAFANRQVLELGKPREALEAVARGGPWREGIDRGLFLSIDPALERLYVGEGGGDPYEVVVWADAGEARRAIGEVRALLGARMVAYENAGLDVGDWIGLDRLAEARGVGPAAGQRRVYDLRGTERLGVLVDPRLPAPGDADRWLGLFRDDTGKLDPRRRSSVLSVGPGADGSATAGFVGGEPFPPMDPRDPSSPPAAPVRMAPITATSKVFARPSPDGLTLAVTVQQRLKLEAVGGDVPWFDLNFFSVEAVPGSFGIDRVTLPDGTPVADPDSLRPREGKAPPPPPPPEPEPPGEREREREKPPPFDDFHEEPGDSILVFPPAPVRAGQPLELVVEWHDTWRWANHAECGLPTNAGVGSGLTWYLPAPQAGLTGTPWRFRTQVAVPEDSGIQVAASGHTVNEWRDQGWRWTDTSGPNRAVRWPGLVLGRFSGHDEEAVVGYPAVRARLFSGRRDELKAVAPYVRQILNYYAGFLPFLVLPEYDVAQQPSACGGFVWVAPYGMAAVQTAMVPAGQDDTPTGTDRWLAERILAHEIAHQYFGQVLAPPHTDDMWASEAFSEAFACMYAGAAFGGKACDRALAETRRKWESATAPRRAALSEAYGRGDRGDLVYGYGPYVLLEVLRPRIGSAAYFAALAELAGEGDGRPASSERIEAAFSRAAGWDLSGFFDYWIYGGYLPEVDLAWSAREAPEGWRLTLSLTSDVPFGTFDAPIRLTWADGRVEDRWVPVVDGRGAVELGPMADVPKVALDPDHHLLARARRVKRAGP